ncbi:hypothetical protein HERIO_727 [Hepatospora eriocheir]|uniref:Uncharacterized protein n=1 Tax=Hepatospora eriocheir TaxID=1081669 RepID=A0A1X0QC86_9MICR|nr:hypothetical protein HERIO_727 [Hepatospora eriocheir]
MKSILLIFAFIKSISSLTIHYSQKPCLSYFSVDNVTGVVIPKYSFNFINPLNNTLVHNYENKYYLIYSKYNSIDFEHIKSIGRIFEYPYDIERGIKIMIIDNGNYHSLRDICSYINFSAQFSNITISGVMLTILLKFLFYRKETNFFIFCLSCKKFLFNQ